MYPTEVEREVQECNFVQQQMALVEYVKFKIQIKLEKLVISKEENIQNLKYIRSRYPPC